MIFIKKNFNVVFIIVCLIIVLLPLVFFDFDNENISLSENRSLSKLPDFSLASILNNSYFEKLESWFNDHIGLRSEIISYKGKLDFYLFDKIDVEDRFIGKNGDLIYASDEDITNYQGKNLLSQQELNDFTNYYNDIANYFKNKGIYFIYVPCYDKHSIYPEQFMNGINKYSDLTRTDQIVSKLILDGNVNVANIKPKLIEHKKNYSVYGNWSDPTHWTQRGAYIGYLEIMNSVSKKSKVKILQEKDYEIKTKKVCVDLNGNCYKNEDYEIFEIKNPKAVEIDNSVLGILSKDESNKAYYNSSSKNQLKTLIFGDSYIWSFLLDDLAESFEYTYMIWNNYFLYNSVEQLVNNLEPDVVILENVERVNLDELIKLFGYTLNYMK